MKRSIIAVVVATAVVLSAGAAFAQKGQAPKAPKTQSAPKTHVTKTSGATTKPAAAQGPKTTRGAATATTSKVKAPKTTTTKTSPGTTKASSSKPSKTTTTASAKKADKKTTVTSTTTTERTPTTTPTTPLTPVQQKLERNTNLADKLQSRLPDGMDLMKAAEGFRTLGEFVSTVNVSNNLGLSFEKLKTLRVEDGMSLGQSIQKLKMDADGTVEARRATTEADRMIATTEEEMRRKQRAKAPKAKMGSGS